MILFLLKGILIGLLASPPTGPVGVLCIRRSLIKKRMSGFFTGIGATVADLFYGIIAVIGVAALSNFIDLNQDYIKLLGGMALISLGTWDWFVDPKKYSKRVNGPTTYIRDFFSGFAITILNSANFILFLIAFSVVLGNNPLMNWTTSIIVVLGTLVGSLLSWTILNSIVIKFRHKVKDGFTSKITKASGILFIVFGLIILIKLLI